MNKRSNGPLGVKRWALILLAVLVPAVSAACVSQGAGNAANTAAPINYVVQNGNISISVHGTGSIQPLESHSYSAPADGQIKLLAAQEGDAAQAMQLIALMETQAGRQSGFLDTDKTAALTLSSTNSSGITSVTAPSKGRIKDIKVQENDRISDVMKQYGYLAIISSDDMLKLSFAPAEDVTYMPGDKVKVQIGEKKATGTITDTGDESGLIHLLIEDSGYASGAEAQVLNAAGETVGTGQLAINAPVPVVAWDGYADSLSVKENKTVSAGSTLFKLQQTGYAKGSNAFIGVYAPMEGLLTAVPADKSTVKTGDAYMGIQVQSGYELEVSVDELDIGQVSTGQDATITIDALPNQTLSGRVSKVGKVGTSNNNVTKYTVAIRLEHSEGLLSGMNASCEIMAVFLENVPVVPVIALQSLDGKYYVAKPSDTETEATAAQSGQRAFDNLAEVEVGVNNGTIAQIISGLSAGDVILYTPMTRNSNNGNNPIFMMPAGGVNRVGGGQSPARQQINSSGSGPSN